MIWLHIKLTFVKYIVFKFYWSDKKAIYISTHFSIAEKSIFLVDFLFAFDTCFRCYWHGFLWQRNICQHDSLQPYVDVCHLAWKRKKYCIKFCHCIYIGQCCRIFCWVFGDQLWHFIWWLHLRKYSWHKMVRCSLIDQRQLVLHCVLFICSIRSIIEICK